MMELITLSVCTIIFVRHPLMILIFTSSRTYWSVGRLVSRYNDTLMPLEFAERTIVQGLQASYIILVASYAGEGFIPVPAEKFFYLL